MMKDSPIMIHTDLSKIKRSTIRNLDLKNSAIAALHNHLKKTFLEQELWFPAFNYDFAKTGTFDPLQDEIQVGALNESLRVEGEYSRSPVPIFSFLRPKNAQQAKFRSELDPFDELGEFSELRQRDGSIIFFGASIISMTYIHYIETLVGVPYRYKKNFRGKVRLGDKTEKISLTYLVRPQGFEVEYDWKKIYALMSQKKIPYTLKNFGEYEIYDSNVLAEFMIKKYQEDIFWTLTNESKIRAISMINILGRKFDIKDFEDSEKNA